MSSKKHPQKWDLVKLVNTTLPGKIGFNDGDWIESPYITSSGIRLIQTSNIGNGNFLDKPNSKKFISTRTFKQLGCKWVKPGDLLICRMADPIGRACFVPDHVGNSVTSVDCTIYRPSPNIANANYILHRMNSEEHLREVLNVSGGSTRQRISRRNLGNIIIPLPPLPEQRRIAEILDTLDEAIRKTEAIIAKFEKMKEGLLHDLLTRGVDEHGQLRPTREEAPELYKESELGWVPKEWKISALFELVQAGSTITYGVVQPGPRVENGVLFVRGGDFPNGQIIIDRLRTISKSVHKQYHRTHLQGEEVLVSLVGLPGSCAVVPANLAGGNIARQVAIIRPTHELNSNFLKAYISSTNGQKALLADTLGSVQKVVNLRDLKELLIPLPTTIEQNCITQKLIQVEAQATSELHQLLKLQTLKQGLMDDLLTGRVRVPVTEEDA